MRELSKIDAQSEEVESLENDDHIGHMLSTMIIAHLRKDARTSYLGNVNDLHGCRLGAYSINSDEEEGFFFERTMKKQKTTKTNHPT